MGPYFLDIFDPRAWGHASNTITLEVMRIVLATGLFAIGVELPKSYMAQHAKSLSAMVIPTMAIGWIVVAGTNLSNRFLASDIKQYFRIAPWALSATEFHFVLGHLCLSDTD